MAERGVESDWRVLVQMDNVERPLLEDNILAGEYGLEGLITCDSVL